MAAMAITTTGLSGPTASAQQGESEPQDLPVPGMKTLQIGPSPTKPTYVREQVAKSPAKSGRAARAVAGSYWKVYYQGFTPEVQAAFQRAVDIWSRKLTSNAPITVAAVWADLPDKVLAQAGPNELQVNFAGAEKRNTIYPASIANHLQRKQIDGTRPDIKVMLNKNYAPDFHFGADPAPADKVDFTTTVLHELGHGLGSAGFGTVSKGLGRVKTVIGGQSYLTPFDHFTTTGDGGFLTKHATNSVALGNHLQWIVKFDSPQVRAVNGGEPARLYSPRPFEPGSSYTHLDENTYPAGNPNSLMTPSLGRGETIRDPGELTMAMYDSMGW